MTNEPFPNDTTGPSVPPPVYSTPNEDLFMDQYLYEQDDTYLFPDHNEDIESIVADPSSVSLTGLQKFLQKRADKHNQGILVLENNTQEVKVQGVVDPQAEMTTSSHYKHRLKTVRKQNKIRTEHSRIQHNLRRSYGEEIADPDYLSDVKSEKYGLTDRYARKQQKAKVKAHRRYMRSVSRAGDSLLIREASEDGASRTEIDRMQDQSKIGKRINKTPLRTTLYGKSIKGAYKLSSTGTRAAAFSGEVKRAWNEESSKKTADQAHLYELLAKTAVGEMDITEFENAIQYSGTVIDQLKINKFKKLINKVQEATDPKEKEKAQKELNKSTDALFNQHSRKIKRSDRTFNSAQKTRTNQPARYTRIKNTRRDVKDLIIDRKTLH